MKELDSFTAERLEELSTKENIPEVAALARIALAAKRAEPVTWWTGPEPTLTGEIESFHDHETGSHYLPLVVSLSAYSITPQLSPTPSAWEVNGILCHTKEEADLFVGTPVPLYEGLS